MDKVWHRLADVGVEFNYPEQAMRIRFLNSATWIAIATLFWSWCMDLLSRRFYTTPFVLGMFVPLFLVIWAQQKRKYPWARFLFLVVFTATFLSGNFFNSFVGNENYLFVILLIGYSVLERRISQILLTVYCIVLYLLLIGGMDSGVLQQGDLPRFYYYVNSALALGIVSLLVRRYVRIVAQQMLSMESLNEDLRKKNILTEKLLKELNHRVKNNLQIIASLFSLQGNGCVHPETRQALSDAKSRIQSMAILHQKLYQGELLFDVNIKEYVQSLCEFLRHDYAHGGGLHIDVQCPEFILPIRDAIYVGLIINELLTNSQKYAQRPGCTLLIEVSLQQEQGWLVMVVQDNGPGFSKSLEDLEEGHFGLGLVRTIVEQYDGGLRIAHAAIGGAVVQLNMKIGETNNMEK